MRRFFQWTRRWILGASGRLDLFCIAALLAAGCGSVAGQDAADRSGGNAGHRVEHSRESRFTTTRFTTANGLPQNSVRSLLTSHDGRLWIGTSCGVARFDDPSFTVFDEFGPAELNGDLIAAMAEDVDQHLWLGTVNGVIEVAGATLRWWNPTNGFPVQTVSSIVADPRGGVWEIGRAHV